MAVKSLCNTHWESRIKSVKAIRYQAPQLKKALLKLHRTSNDDPKTKSDAKSLVAALQNFEFLVGMVIWHDVLFTINMVTKKLQSTIVDYRNDGFASSLIITKSIASDMGIGPAFPVKRRVTRTRQFDENSDNEENDQNEEAQAVEEESFRLKYFLVMIDVAIASQPTDLRN
ncbi:hypothetical protein BRADI_1g47806v3 [Brachypodium distachyon]|uniref:Uncharacterized protein n=1 Tax=Brachypodium distachyon TaxID=15368 RepID=A0A2K2DQ48_BRADI|nr:hypothetical protein BRADI_1g47806v3 [Brachypodium distachyon]